MSQTVVYLDSGLYIAHHRALSPTRERARALWEDASHRLVTSTMVALEILPKAAYANQQKELDLYRRLLARASTHVELTEPLMGTALELGMRYGLQGADAIHTACALAAGCTELWTAEAASSPWFRLPPSVGLAVRTVLG
ncbi:MAG: type II toxin-antitoxin system VapC family toxin [Armatimonadetes bacterium]|nr:type II toxin-antitoxin system VapC family toxin [Armatimonadota bacterium]